MSFFQTNKISLIFGCTTALVSTYFISGREPIYGMMALTSTMIFLYYFQDVLIYARFYMLENDVKIPSYLNLQQFFIETTDKEKLHCYYCDSKEYQLDYQQDENAKNTSATIFYLHGNAGTIHDRIYVMDILYKMKIFNVFLLDYRGYGKSSGYPSEDGLYNDVDAGYSHLLSRKDIDQNKIVMYGHSLGGAVLVGALNRWFINKTLAPKIDPYFLIIQNTFTSTREMGSNMFPILKLFIHYAPKFVLRNKFNSIDTIQKIPYSMLFLSCSNDNIVPKHMMNSLYEKAGSDHGSFKKMYNYHECDHNNLFLEKNFCIDIFSFYNQIVHLHEL
ncbi:Abhydrolase domain-containing protein 13 [Intoshia linei]|uniref:Protein ABHD13 n=1 Tax=Intoshia linei TaxID=1819745 RepID=A0A177AW72_9BILA|nr:Abhydrolase domain-containing protein 13 [Intoshia linei]